MTLDGPVSEQQNLPVGSPSSGSPHQGASGAFSQVQQSFYFDELSQTLSNNVVLTLFY
jgi:hypothetical protein